MIGRPEPLKLLAPPGVPGTYLKRTFRDDPTFPHDLIFFIHDITHGRSTTSPAHGSTRRFASGSFHR